ncbi:M23 family metallopeptidase [Yoonia sediminilitoris]|uniref:Murein DD-endopeptidase MepM/ murein hydrolase activator NlpD n=1 Tax=Yoonia sediminilitoris TaxID=1286148 RepID=A0A2T6KE23_9RHOB|nr:M23 family metallopeptidase [Yoonia sediminilitoris]PUB13258.1 murein DD-endopeptidase MepM/ murein hydrolase activator NlpD [Yoonia sediminilitoris]RCW94593.1 murein DD-endopeptidase MepM/ murein hydrolase activator NlpD [Yoonia sediminilitoris]
MSHRRTKAQRAVVTGIALIALTACEEPFDFDLRDTVNGFDTSRAVQNLPGRPRPDERGVITYPTYQVVVAQRDDTIRGIAIRLGLDANELATYNGIEPDVVLRRDEIIALPNPLPDANATPVAGGTGLDISAVATSALDRADASGRITATPLDPVAAPVAAAPAVPEPIRHQVKRGETVYSISRLYKVPVKSIAEWNGLNSEFTVREGQFLLVPQDGASAPAAAIVPAANVTQPGEGTVTPLPPSAATPLPNEVPSAPLPAAAVPAAPDLGTPTASPASSNARFVRPAEGSIIGAYAPGKNEGIDIAAPAGATVKAADAGTVAAVTSNTSGINIVVIKHSDGLLTVYTNIDSVSVSKDDQVSRGQSIAKVKAADRPVLHFEVRRGLKSVDPTDYLP